MISQIPTMYTRHHLKGQHPIREGYGANDTANVELSMESTQVASTQIMAAYQNPL